MGCLVNRVRINRVASETREDVEEEKDRISEAEERTDETKSVERGGGVCG